MKTDIIIVSGLGDLSDETEYLIEEYTELATKYNVEFYPTYYDYEFKGERGKIQALLEEQWNMRDEEEWLENGLCIQLVESEEL